MTVVCWTVQGIDLSNPGYARDYERLLRRLRTILISLFRFLTQTPSTFPLHHTNRRLCTLDKPHAFSLPWPKVATMAFCGLCSPSQCASSGRRSTVGLTFEERLQRALRKAATGAGVVKPVSVIGHRHSHGARVVGPQQCKHNHDSHTCAQGGSGRHHQPFGFTASGLSRPHSRTGIPRSRMRSLACCTVYSP